MKTKAILICSECLSRNYEIRKNDKDPQRFEVMKYCVTCKKHTLHKESK